MTIFIPHIKESIFVKSWIKCKPFESWKESIHLLQSVSFAKCTILQRHRAVEITQKLLRMAMAMAMATGIQARNPGFCGPCWLRAATASGATGKEFNNSWAAFIPELRRGPFLRRMRTGLPHAWCLKLVQVSPCFPPQFFLQWPLPSLVSTSPGTVLFTDDWWPNTNRFTEACSKSIVF